MNEELLRQEVATCIRLLEETGLMDFSGHVSARIPSTNEFFINSRDQSRSSIRPQDLLKLDLEGQVIEGEGRPPMEVAIHTAVYRARPDVLAVGHIHPFHTVALSAANREYVPVIYHGAIFGPKVPVYDDCRHINTKERGEMMADVLGKGKAVIIRGHGATLAAGSVKGVFLAAVYLEDNARHLAQAYNMGEPRVLYSEELAEGPRIWTELQFNKVWNYYLNKTEIKSEKDRA